MGKPIPIDDLPASLAARIRDKDPELISKKYNILGKVLVLVSSLSRREAIWVLRTIIRHLTQRKDQTEAEAKDNHRGKES